MINCWSQHAAPCCDGVPATGYGSTRFWMTASVLFLFSHISSLHFYVSSSVLSFLRTHNPPFLSHRIASDQRIVQTRHFGRKRLWPIEVLTRMYLGGVRSHETLFQQPVTRQTLKPGVSRLQFYSINLFDISIIDKTPTHALFTQHYISLACWFH